MENHEPPPDFVTRDVLQFLSPGKWVSLALLIARYAPGIPPERAMNKWRERSRAKGEAKQRVPDMREQLARGKRAIVIDTLKELERQQVIERREGGGKGNWDYRKAIWFCASCGERQLGHQPGDPPQCQNCQKYRR